ncbi:MAG TPA: homoserine dehydrogenase [Terriglobales bacterium]|nr:homoserine dehydrogenase [Terriglobales bacterium]
MNENLSCAGQTGATSASEGARSGRPLPTLAAEEARVLNLALLGFGTVGSSVARILSSAACQLRLTHVFNRGVERKRVDWLPPDIRWTDKFEDALDESVDIVVELVGGLEPAREWVRRALLAGKSVVTANKQLIAQHGAELLELAQGQRCHLVFGASVAGGVPVVSGLQEGLAGDRLYKVCGILNGTCNYILSRIEESGVGFSAALREAQRLGYAESDPTDDVEGFDARAKLAILARVGLNCEVCPGDIACRSIATLEAVDFLYARDLGCTIRQISCAEVKDGRLFASVQPALVPLASPLARVQGSQNLVMATGEFGGETVFSGYGAGGNPTAVAVVSDLIAIAEGRMKGWHSAPAQKLAVTSEFSAPHHLRFTVSDRPGIIAAVSGILAKYGISIEAVLQKPDYPKARLPFVITLEECPSSLVDGALEELRKLDFLVEPILSLPMLR